MANILNSNSGLTHTLERENQLHWTLDVAFGDDAFRKQKDNAAQNFSLSNRIGLNIIKNAKVSSIGVKGQPHRFRTMLLMRRKY